MNPSKEHNNWLTVGEMINLIKEPVALYTSHITERLHATLCSLPLGRCPNIVVCQAKKHPNDLCLACKGWYDELVKSHRNKNTRQIKWRENCDTSKWPNDPWEVAKFFMPVLGKNKTAVIDADSTDLSSLLNVLEWTKDAVFAPDKRVDRNLVTQLRDIRNSWAHAPGQKLPDPFLNKSFDIANKFVADLDIVFSCDEVQKCIEFIKVLQANGISNVTETELKNLNLLRIELGGDVSQMKEELKRLKDDQSSDRQVIKKLEEKVENLEIDIFNATGTDPQTQLKSCIPDKPKTFIGRDIEVKQIISSLVENDCGIVSIVGGPGFGKTTVAVEVSHHLRYEHDIVVIFSFLSYVLTVSGVRLRLCHDVGINPGEDPELSLMFWLKSIERKVVLVMDNIEQLLENDVKSQFVELVHTLRKNSRQHLQILTTTRTEFTIGGQTTVNHKIGGLDELSSVELLEKCRPNEFEKRYLSELAYLCGFVPLALCIVGTIIPDLDNPSELTQWLIEKPMEALRNSDLCVEQAIEFSFQKLSDEDQRGLICLSVFDGDFQRKSAEEVIEKNGLKTQSFLRNLVNRSLVQTSGGKRFVIHSLIRRFLSDHAKYHDERALAQVLMVRHFLKMCHSLTVNSYSFNGFTTARESLKKDIHNVEKTLKICSQKQATDLNRNICEFLASSDIYKSSYRFFHNLSWDLLTETILRDFSESCIKLAESQNEPIIAITFQCQIASQEGNKSAWTSTEYVNRMENFNAAFRKHEAILREDRSLFMFCHYRLARYYFRKIPKGLPAELIEEELPPLPENKVLSPITKAAEASTLMKRGTLSKLRANRMFHEDKEKSAIYMKSAESFYKQALSLAEELLGDHKLTCTLHKLLGDLCFNCSRTDDALALYLT